MFVSGVFERDDRRLWIPVSEVSGYSLVRYEFRKGGGLVVPAQCILDVRDVLDQLRDF